MQPNKPGKSTEDTDLETTLHQEFLRVHKAILSPFRRLPNEIIGEIICHFSQSCAPRDPYKEIRMALGFWDNDDWPVVPSHVCLSWRAIALSLRHLWAHIVIDTCVWELKRPPKRFVHSFKTILSRSAGAPLAISICHQAPIQDFDPILDILMSHADKWETLHITSYRSLLKSFQRVKENLPILRRVYLSLSDDENGSGAPIDLFEIAPRLRMVHIHGPKVEDVLLPLSQIKHYATRSEHSNSAGDVLISNSPLADLRMANLTLNDLLKYWPARTLDDLKYLHLDFDAPPDDAEDLVGDNMLNSLTLPSICSIKITNYPDAILSPLTALISRSLLPGTCLWKLEFSTYHLREFAGEELTALFQLTPCLMSLSMYLPSSYVLSWLIHRPDSDVPALLPNLQHLYFFVATDALDGTEYELRQIAQTRCEIQDPKTSNNHAPYGQVRRLQDFRIVFPMTSLCHDGLELLEEKGSYFSNRESVARIESLKDWTGVINSLPNFFYYNQQTPPKMIKLRRALELARFFTAIESVCVEYVRELYQSDIHHLMYHLYKLSPSDLPGENIYHFRKRAKAMLDNWSSLLRNDVKNRNWAFQGQNSIYYICNDHWIRDLPDDEILEWMIYGQNFYSLKYSKVWYDMLVSLTVLD
ncbi:hypothetical protein M413DRAFT_440300 [Hebeloma cylindrosporum]|uniref:F-box domain-containing protein n=1 Tax=Hebeloma cylindrosporum TaxID=76867 RepID=A0A0C3CS60_HEBCY|nr:hypothetical protein M413DRAFT_440300 [Hebeloma cylindrosporum h7]